MRGLKVVNYLIDFFKRMQIFEINVTTRFKPKCTHVLNLKD